MQSFPSLYNSMVQCFVSTWKSEGVFRGLYAGTVPSLVASVGELGSIFMFYGQCQNVVRAVTGKRKDGDRLK